MNREQIEKVAAEVAREACYDYDAAFEYANGFIFGADWRINSVWHTPNEHPDIYRTILVEDNKGNFSLCLLYSNSASMQNWKRWAYVDELLPIK